MKQLGGSNESATLPRAPMKPRTPLERILFEARLGRTRDQVRASWPTETKWKETPKDLICFTAEAQPFTYLTYVFLADVLYNIKLVIAAPGDFSTLQRLDALVRSELPSIASFRAYGSRDWSVDAARPRLEEKGSEKVMAAVGIEGEVPSAGRLSGKAVAFKRGGAQQYGFELFWFPRE